jgi:PAS domain-containing protein
MQYLNAIFDALNVCLMLVDEKGSVKKVNNAVALWLGKDVSACCGKGPGNAFDCVHALSSAVCGSSPHCPECPIRRAFETALREDRPVHNVEACVVMRRGGREERFWLDVSVDHRGESGTLRIKYRNLEQLDAVLRKLGG